MKILHTADWHIGKSLYGNSLREEFGLFLQWLLDLMIESKIEVLLISGDIFDIANPSHQDKTTFYRFLTDCSRYNIQVVITSGNHDSPAFLEATKSLGEMLNIYTVGFAEPIENQFISLESANGPVHILAVPFLRDGDVRNTLAGESYDSREEALRQGIVNHYKKVKSLSNQKDKDATTIAMGHLYVQGARVSESERDIHIGNLAGLRFQEIGNLFDYWALGHIHKPQNFGEQKKVRYSGSPIALSFSERKDDKIVLILNIKDKHEIEVEPLKVPNFRKLVRITGEYEEIKSKLADFKTDSRLTPYIELIFTHKKRNVSIIQQANTLAQEESDQYIIVHHRINFEETIGSISDFNHDGRRIEELSVDDVFKTRLDQESELSEEDRKSLLAAHEFILNQLNQE